MKRRYLGEKEGKVSEFVVPLRSTTPIRDVELIRQSFDKLLVPDGYVDVLKSKTILEEGCVYGQRAIPFFVSQEVIDIDSAEDLEKIIFEDSCGSEIYRELCMRSAAELPVKKF